MIMVDSSTLSESSCEEFGDTTSLVVLCVFKVNYTVGIKSGKTILVFHPAQP